MAETKFLDSAGLTHLLEKTNAKFSKLGHTHTKAEITDFAHTHDNRYYTETEIDSKLNGKSNTGHTHDDRYYTESEMNTKLAGKSDTTHSHATHLTTEIAASTNLNTLTAAGWYKCSSSATAANLTNCPTKNAFAMEVLSNAGTTQTVYEYMASGQKIYTRNCYDSAWGAWHRIYTEADKPTLGELGAAASGHTHNYAGSSSVGGSANSAVKLDSSAGSATQPVYFSGGKPVAITYTLGKSVPSNAVFTDTTYPDATTSARGLMTAADKQKLDALGGITTITKSLTLTTAWQNTGISGGNLSTGTYVVQVSGLTSDDGISTYSEIWSGVMSWYAGTTNSTNAEEILLHNAGHADNSGEIYLRTIRTSGGNYLKLQIASNIAATKADNVVFKFRKLI